MLDMMLENTKGIKKFLVDATNIRVTHILYLICFKTKDHWPTW